MDNYYMPAMIAINLKERQIIAEKQSDLQASYKGVYVGKRAPERFHTICCQIRA
jgi:hypothetical protein